jgi:hypothetical protein
MKNAFEFQSIIYFSLVLALGVSVIACQPATNPQPPSMREPPLAPRPPFTSLMPTWTAISVAAATTPASTVTPEKRDFGYPPDTRTGVFHLDAIIDAVLANDLARVRTQTHFAPVGCTTAEGFGGPPKCRPGEVPGTSAEVVQVLGPEGFALRRDDPLAGMSAGDYHLVAAVSNVVESIRGEDWWLPAKYALVFGNAAEPGAVILLVDEERIVRFIHVESVDRVWRLVSGDFILPPSG